MSAKKLTHNLRNVMDIQSTLAKPSGNAEIDAQFRKGMHFMKQKRWDKAADIFRNIMHQKPDHFASIEQLGIISRELEEHEQSLIFFKALTEHVPFYPQGYGLAGAALMDMERYEEAEVYLKKALTFGDFHFANIGLGNCYMYMGKNKESEEHMRRAMERGYEIPELLYSYLFFYYTFEREDDPHLKHMLNLAAKAKSRFSNKQQAAIFTTISKAYNDLKDYDKAMKNAAIAGRANLKDRQYSIKASENIYKRIAQYFDEDFMNENKPTGLDSHMPVFILGMPRSGTTLLETILHSHKDIIGIGEDAHLGKLLQHKSLLPPHNGIQYPIRNKPVSNGIMKLEAIGKNHLAYLEAKAKGAKRVVDKGIIQYSWVGLTYLVYPNAYFIHLTRDPLSSAMSSYMHNFAGSAQPYTNDLYMLGKAFRFHYEIMEHWKKVVPTKILDVSYEQLIEDTENQAHRIIEFLDLPWDENCLRFHETKKIVKTASAQQVRKPIYKDSLKTWQKYEKHLAPLVKGLGPYAPEESLYILEKYGDSLDEEELLAKEHA